MQSRSGTTLVENKDPAERKWAVRDAAILAAAFAIFPLILAGPGLDNFYWCEDGATIRWAGEVLADPSAYFRFYGRSFYPVAMAAVALPLGLFGSAPFTVHLADLVLHLANGILLAALFARWTRDSVPAAMAALAWMISRHTDEAYFWLSSRQHALAFFFALAAWHADESGKRRASALLAVLAMLSKETGALVVALMTLRWWWAAGFSLRGAVVRTGWAWGAAIGYAVFRIIAVLSGAREGYPTAWIPDGAAGKFAYLILQYLEVTVIPWDSAWSVVSAMILVGVAARFGNGFVRLGLAWMVLGILLVLPLPTYASRYALHPYAGLLLVVVAGWSMLSAARRRASTAIAIAFYVPFVLYQGYVVFLDEKDYDMRSRFVEQLARDYRAVADEVPDGPIAAVSVAGVDVRPVILERLFVPKPIAPIPAGPWGIIPAEDLVGLVEFERGRTWIAAESAPLGATLLVHHGDTWSVERLLPGDTRPTSFGRLVRWREGAG